MLKHRIKNKINYNRLSPVEVYKLVLTGKIQKFPNGFWNNSDAEENAAEVTRYLLESILDWSTEDIKEKINNKVFIYNKLGGMLSIVFKNSHWQAINAAYPNKFKEWELPFTPNGFWNEETAIRATKWLIEEKLKWTKDMIKEKLSAKVFYENGLTGLICNFYQGSPWRAIIAAYPDQFKEWEFNRVPLNFWNLQRGVEATKWLIEEKLNWTENEIKEKFGKKTFSENGLEGMLVRVFHGSPWRAINTVYPNRFKEWDFKRILTGFWNNETGIRAIKWLIEEKLKWTENDIKKKFTQKVFFDNGLGGMLQTLYNGSPWQAINAVYPGQFKEWELPFTPNGFWNEETAIHATKWLIEEKLKWTELEVKEWLRMRTFVDHGLSMVIKEIYKKSSFKALNAAYPGRYQEKDFGRGRKYKKYPF